ncbi:hypothetical protein E2A64_05970 [Pseudohoeflea suaedae]|uniref:Uncharacterized protein n=1 Tax=Pseudohoeflea suaedae TaxID=877384 RepID=A0A4R5PNK9_9HYPH|nr:plant virulence effector HPE1-like domain-containing protein [Pseudohoeflea suaedae]TDH38644.1 hypothetical protein E2A64_05970 [Pseudohoeflea suaedae]
MRAVLLTGLLALGVTHANAGSIEYLTSSDSPTSRSVTEIGCPTCFKQEQKKKAEDDMLPPGTEVKKIEVIDGEPHLVTTENWLGGNPVTIVRKASERDIAQLDPQAGAKTEVAEAPVTQPEEPAITTASQTIPGGELTVVSATSAPLVIPEPPVVAEISGTPSELVSEPDSVASTSGVPEELDMSDFALRVE